MIGNTLVIDTDTHLTEPPTLWTDRMSKSRWGDLIPHVKRIEADRDAWFIGDKRVANQVGHSQFAVGEGGRADRIPGGSGGPDTPQSFDTVHPSAFEPNERLKVMDASGVDVAALYPNLSFFGYEGFYRQVSEADFQLECVRAYNDFILDFTSVAPERFIPLAVIPYWDIPEAVKEIERCAALGFKGIITTAAPHFHGQPFLADRHWDPMWAAAQAAEMPINFHVGGGDLSGLISAEREEVETHAASHARLTTAVFLDNGHQMVDLLNSGVLPRFPNLKFVSVESGLGWLPFVLESVDYHFDKLDVFSARPEYKAKPSEYFRNQVYVNFWFEKLDPFHVERVGVNNILFETDFPHATCIAFEEVEQTVDDALGHVDPVTRERILWRNAADLYRLDVSAFGVS